MVAPTAGDSRYYIASRESDIDRLLSGGRPPKLRESELFAENLIRPGGAGILVSTATSGDLPNRPLVINCHEEDVRRLCGRYASVHTDFSPLTAWCHLLNPEFHRHLDGVVHSPKYRNTEAAWSGLVVAETLLLSRKRIADVPITACFASASYAIARSVGLWSHLPIGTIFDRFESASTLCRGDGATISRESRVSKVRSAFLPIWTCLATLVADSDTSNQKDLLPIIDALTALHDARFRGDPREASHLAKPLLEVVPEAKAFDRLHEMAPEVRLKLFDELVNLFGEMDVATSLRRNALAFAASYVATVAAGGAASLALVEDFADDSPELTGWAYLVGGVGERVTWTSGLDGLGRLVARELLRPFRLDDPPTCDFAFDEAQVLADFGLMDPLVHLRVKHAKVVSVALFPGVNASIPKADKPVEASSQKPTRTEIAVSSKGQGSASSDELFPVLAQALWPHLQPLVVEETRQRFERKRTTKQRSSGKKRGTRSLR